MDNTMPLLPNDAKLSIDNLHHSLKAFEPYKQFIGYVLKPRINNPGKMDKRPFNYNIGQTDNALDPTIWMNAATAIALSKLYGEGYGVGFVLTKEDPFCCIDLDNCLETSGDISTATPIALELMAMFPGAAVEISSSGEGLHLFFSYRGSAPPHARKNQKLKIELYTEKRFIALTGRDASGDAETDYTEALHKLIITHFPETRGTGDIPQGWEAQVVQEVDPAWSGPIDDNELIERMVNAKASSQSAFGDKATLRDLWERNIAALVKAFPDDKHECGYDESSADSALACHLAFWTGKDAERTRRLMLLSGLKRDKWDRVDYLPRTILRAFSIQQKVYSWSCASTPKPLPDSRPDVLQFQREMLPEALRDYVFDIAARQQSAPDFIAITAMVGLSGLLGRKALICPKQHDDWTVTPNLWGAIIGRPSAMKSPSMKEALKPIQEIEANATRQYKEAEDRFAAEKYLMEVEKKAAQNEAKNNIKKDREKALKLLENINKNFLPPARTRFTVNDATVEKLGELLNENSNGLLLIRDELSGWLAKLYKEEYQGDRAFYLECFDGNGNYRYDRIGRGTVDIEHCILSIIGGIQPTKIARLVRDTITGVADDGLIQRFQLVTWPDDRGKWKWIDRAPNEEARKAYYAVFNTIHNLVFETETTRFRFNIEAQPLFIQWMEELQTQAREGGLHPALESHLLKMPKIIASLALLFELIDGGREAVGIEATQRALIWAEYLISHAHRLYSIATNQDIDNAHLILKRKKDLNNSFTARDIHRKNWTGLNTIDAVKDALGCLIEYNYLTEISLPPSPQGGRGSSIYEWKDFS